MLIYKQHCNLNAQKFLFLMAPEPCIITLKLSLNFSDYEPKYSYKLYSYEKSLYGRLDAGRPGAKLKRGTGVAHTQP